MEVPGLGIQQVIVNPSQRTGEILTASIIVIQLYHSFNYILGWLSPPQASLVSIPNIIISFSSPLNTIEFLLSDTDRFSLADIHVTIINYQSAQIGLSSP